MSSRKEQPTLKGTGSLADLLLTTEPAPGAAGGGLDALLGGGIEHPDPIGPFDYENATNEQAVQHEVSETLKAFKARAEKEQARFELATDSEYWVALCFQTRAQKEAFLEGVQLLAAGDKYIDGRLLAKRMGIVLPAADVPYNVSARPDAKLAAMVKS